MKVKLPKLVDELEMISSDSTIIYNSKKGDIGAL